MTPDMRPPALDLRDEAAVTWTSMTKVIRDPEENWPVQILERPIIARRIGRSALALIADPEAAMTILSAPEGRFPRWRIYSRVFAEGLGRHSLSVVEGEQWRRQRRVLAPMLRGDQLPLLAGVLREAAELACSAWLEQRGEVRIDAAEEMTRIALGAIWTLMFGADNAAACPAQVADAARSISMAQAEGRLDELPRCLTALARNAQATPHGPGVFSPNPFARLGEAEAAGGDALTPPELFDNTRVFLGAGSETTALTLTWALWLIGQRPDIQRRAQDEIDSVCGLGSIDSEHIDRLVLVGRILNETLRLFPPSVVIVRQARNEEQLAGEVLPAGSVLAISLYAMHRHRTWWSDPDEFRPERFAPGSNEPRHAFAFLPFSAGGHSCIGARFGWAEAVIVLATMLKRFDVVADPAVIVKPRVMITMRPDRATPLTLRPRR